MIILKMYCNKWQIHIGDEIWQFDTVDEMQGVLRYLISIKDKYGKIKQTGGY